MANKRFRNGTWHYTVSRKILPKRIFLTFDDEQEGDAYIKQLEALLDAGIIPDGYKPDERPIKNISDAVDQYIEAVNVPESDQNLCRISKERIGSVKIEKLTYEWAESWVAEMKAKNLSPSTIRHHVGALARCFDWLERKQVILSNPLRKLPKRYATGHREETERDRRISKDEIAEVLRIIDGGKPKTKERGFAFTHPHAMRLLFVLALETGMRMAEIYTLTSDQIDLNAKTVFLEKTKNGDKRQVPLSSVAIKAIRDYLTVYPDNVMFPWTGTSKAITGRLSQTFGRIFEAAECGDFTFHGLRHEATCRLYERTTLTDVQIAKILGWRSLKMAMRYANLRASDLADSLW